MPESIKIKIKASGVSQLGKAFKTVPGWKHHTNLQVWEFPDITIFDLARVVKDLHPTLHDHLLNNKAFAQQRYAANRAMASTQASRKMTADVAIPCPRGESYKGYQLAFVEYILNRPSQGALLADDMGLGKTIQTLAFYNYMWSTNRNRVWDMLVVCPATVKWNWYKEAKKWVVDRKAPIQVLEGKKPPAGFQPEGICIINYDILADWYYALGIKWDIFTADESTYFKNAKAKRSLTGLILAGMSDWRVFLSGTPIERQPSEIWTTINTVDPEHWNDEFKFKYRYCGPKKNYFTGFMQFNGSSNVAELGVKLRETCMMRRLKEDVAKELPPKVYQTITFNPVTGLPKSVVEEMAAWKAAKRQGMSLENMEALVEKDSTWAAIRQKSAMAKLPDCLEFIEELLEKTDKVIVFAHHQMVQERVAQHFKDRCCLGRLAGTPKKRQEQVDKFNDPKFQGVFVGSLRGDRTGINLQTSDTVVFIEQDPVPGVMNQAEDRAHRTGQKRTVFIYSLVLKGSVDEELADTRKERERTIRLAMA